MPTPAQIERQIQLETQQIQDGIAQLRDNTRKAQDSAYASSTVYAQKMLKPPSLPSPLRSKKSEQTAPRGKGAALAPLGSTRDHDDNVVAKIVLKVLFDCASSPKDKADNTVKASTRSAPR